MIVCYCQQRNSNEKGCDHISLSINLKWISNLFDSYNYNNMLAWNRKIPHPNTWDHILAQCLTFLHKMETLLVRFLFFRSNDFRKCPYSCHWIKQYGFKWKWSMKKLGFSQRGTIVETLAHEENPLKPLRTKCKTH